MGPRVKAMLTLLPGDVFSKGTQEFSFLVFADARNLNHYETAFCSREKRPTDRLNK